MPLPPNTTACSAGPSFPFAIRLCRSDSSGAPLQVSVYAECSGPVTVRLSFIGGDGRLLPQINGRCPALSVPTEFRSLSRRSLPAGIAVRSPQAAWQSDLRLKIDASLQRRAASVRLEIVEDDGTCWLMERRKSSMALSMAPKGRQEQYGFPQRIEDTERRINLLLDGYRCLTADSPSAADALTRLWVSLRGGYDTPLLDL